MFQCLECDSSMCANIMSHPSPLQGLVRSRLTAASRPAVCQPEHPNGPGSDAPTSPWRSWWSSSWSRAPKPRTTSTGWKSSACKQKTGAGKLSMPGNCTCFRCLARCSPASPLPDPAQHLLCPRRRILAPLRSFPVPPRHIHVATPVFPNALRPRQTLSHSRIHFWAQTLRR